MISQLMVFMIRQSKSLHPSPFVSSPRHLASAAPPHSALFAVAVRPHQPPRNRRLSTSGPTCASAGSQASGPSNEEPLPFSEYTAEANSAYWTTRPVAVAKRLIQVTTALGSWLAVANFGGGGIEQRADKLRRILTTLGPAYVKIGQAVSSR